MYSVLVFLFIIFSIICPNSICEEVNKENFWNVQRKGANIFNINVNENIVRSAKGYNIQFVRLAIDKFPTKHRDFLIGDCDNYTGLVSEDLLYLKNVLDIFLKNKMPVVITMLSLPGARWKQMNNGKNDFRIYQDDKFAQQAVKFWFDLAGELKKYDNIIGYNLLNEPRFERVDKIEHCSKKYQDKLFEIYERIILQIREFDKKIPIILDVSNDSSPECFKYLVPIKDENIIYSFHMYEPFEYTFSNAKWNKNKGKYTSYPAIMNKGKQWGKEYIQKYLKIVSEWQSRYNINSNQIIVGEFGADRTNKCVDLYFKDLIDIFDEHKWHWAFYSFREDVWEKMDYELGSLRMGEGYWKNYSQCQKIKFNDIFCQNLNEKYYKRNRVFDVLLNRLR